MRGDFWSCISPSQRMVDLLMALLCLTLAVAFGVLARRRFLAGRRGRGWALVAGAVASGAIAELWVICTFLGVPPFFMGEIQLLPCDRGRPEQGVVLRRSSLPVHPPIPQFVIDDIGARSG